MNADKVIDKGHMANDPLMDPENSDISELIPEKDDEFYKTKKKLKFKKGRVLLLSLFMTLVKSCVSVAFIWAVVLFLLGFSINILQATGIFLLIKFYKGTK
jgi:hypothetical protein